MRYIEKSTRVESAARRREKKLALGVMRRFKRRGLKKGAAAPIAPERPPEPNVVKAIEERSLRRSTNYEVNKTVIIIASVATPTRTMSSMETVLPAVRSSSTSLRR